MLVEQGAAAFRCWFGIEPSRDVMWKSLGLNGPPQHRAIRSST
jgi:shikimate 5-dehydrogenase